MAEHTGFAGEPAEPARGAALAALCVLVRADASAAYRGSEGLAYFTGLSRQTAGTQALCLHLVAILPGGRARAHLHAGHETAICVLGGQAEKLEGSTRSTPISCRLETFTTFLPKCPISLNLGQTEPCTAIIESERGDQPWPGSMRHKRRYGARPHTRHCAPHRLTVYL